MHLKRLRGKGKTVHAAVQPDLSLHQEVERNVQQSPSPGLKMVVAAAGIRKKRWTWSGFLQRCEIESLVFWLPVVWN